MTEELIEVKVVLARMEGKQDAVHALITQHLLDDKEVHQDFESRLRSLEMTKWRAHGIAAAIGGAVAYAVGFFHKGGP